MESMSTQQDLYNKALNSNNALEEANQKKAESIQGKVTILQNKTKEMWAEIINSDALKSGIDLLTKFIEKFGNLPAIIGLATSALIAFKGQAITSFAIFQFGEISALFEIIKSEVVKATVGMTGFTKAATGAKAAMGGLTTLMNINPFMLAAASIALVVVRIATLKTSIDKITDGIDSMKKSSEDLDKVSSGESLAKQYETLETKMNSGNLSNDEMIQSKKDLISVQEQLAQTFPDLISGFSEEGNAIVTSLDRVNKKIEETRKNSIAGMKNGYEASLKAMDDKYYGNNIGDRIESYVDNDLEIFDVIGFTAKYNKLFTDTIRRISSDKPIDANMTDMYKYYVDNMSNLSKNELKDFNEIDSKLKDFNSQVKTIYNTTKNLDDLKGLKYFNFDTNELEDAYEYFNKLSTEENNNTTEAEKNATAMQKQVENAEKLKKEIDGLIESFGYFTSDINMIDKVIEEMQKYGGITSSTYESLLKDHPEVLKALMSEGSSIENLTKLREKDVQKQKDAQEKATQKVLNTNYDETGNVISSNNDIQTVQDSENKKRQIYAETENQRRQNNSDTTNELGSNAETDFGNTDNTNICKQQSDIDFNNNVRQNYSDTVNQLGSNYQTDAQNFETAEQQKRQALINTQKAALETFLTGRGQKSTWEQLQALKESDKFTGIENADMHKQNNGYKEQLEKAGFVYNGGEWVLKTTVEAKAKVDEVTKNLDNVGAKYKTTMPLIINDTQASQINAKTKSTSSSSTKDYSVENVEDLTDAYYYLNSQLDITDSKLKQLQERYENIYGKDKASAMQEQVDILKQQSSLYAQMEAKMNSELSKQRSELSAKGVRFDNKGIISNYNQLLTSLRNHANSIRTVDEASQEAKKTAIENLKSLKEKMDKYSDTVTKNLEQQKEKWLEVQNQIKDTYKTMEKMVADGESKVSSVISNEIDKRKDKELKAIEEVKKALQDQWDVDDYADQLAEAQNKVLEFENDIMNAIRNGDTNALNSLKKEQQDAIKELDDLQKSHERDTVNDELDSQSEDITNKYDDMKESENMTKLVTDALQTGFISINGEVIKLSDAMNTFVQDTTIGLSNVNTTARELNENLADAIAMLDKMNGYSGIQNLLPSVDYKSLIDSNGIIGQNHFNINDNNSSKSYTINQGDIIINGSTNEEILSKIKNYVDKATDSIVGNFIN